MKKPSLRFDFTFYSDRQLLPFAQGVLSSMTDNPHFTAPMPLLATVQAAFKDYATSIPSANVRNMVNSALKAEKKIVLIQLLRQLAYYVSMTANESLEMLQSSGFQLGNQRQSAGALPAPVGIQLQPGPNEGELLASCTTQRGARLYEGRASQDGETWQWFAASTSTQLLFQGLPPAQMAWVQLRLKNSAGHGPWSLALRGRVG